MNNAYTYANTPYPGTWAAIDSNGAAGGGTPLAQHLGALYNLSTGQAQGVFVMADLYVGRIRRAVGNYTGQTQGVAFRIQAQYGGGWETIARTTRFVAGAIDSGRAESQNREIDVKVPIRTLIKASDVTNGTINSVRVQISVVDTGGAPQTLVSLKACSLSVVILQSTVV